MYKKIYYAHSKQLYGTVREKQELKWLRKRFQVVDPNKDIGERGSIEPYLKSVSECDMVICSEYEKHIGKGVYEEINHALGHKIPVKCLRKKFSWFILQDVKSVDIADANDWKVRYGKVIVGKNGQGLD